MRVIEYIHDNGRLRKHRHFGEGFDYYLGKSVFVHERVNTITKAPYHAGFDAGHIFTQQWLKETVIDIDNHYSNTQTLLKDFGYLDLVNDHFDVIAENITEDMLPSEDLEILKMLGSDNPKRTAMAAIFSLKSMSKNRRQNDMYDVKSALREGEKRIHTVREEYEHSHLTKGIKDTLKKEGGEIPDPPKPPRKWWKGCGQIAQGCALTVGNIGLAFDLLGFPVAPETKTWGSVVSVTTGVGLMMSGIGDLRGE